MLLVNKKPQLMGKPVFRYSTGIISANVAPHCLGEWVTMEDIVGMHYDTSLANFGINEGLSVHIEHRN